MTDHVAHFTAQFPLRGARQSHVTNVAKPGGPILQFTLHDGTWFTIDAAEVRHLADALLGWLEKHGQAPAVTGALLPAADAILAELVHRWEQEDGVRAKERADFAGWLLRRALPRE